MPEFNTLIIPVKSFYLRP